MRYTKLTCNKDDEVEWLIRHTYNSHVRPRANYNRHVQVSRVEHARYSHVPPMHDVCMAHASLVPGLAISLGTRL